MYKAYFDRDPHSIEGSFTLHCNGQPVVYKGLKFERLKARSGQRGHTATSWTRSKSPIPFSNQVKGGKLYLWLNSLARGTKPGKFGIGEAFPISSSLFDWDLIEGPDGKIRLLIRLHGENSMPGSAGCPVIVNERECELLFEFLHTLAKTLKYIEIEVL